MSIYGLVDTQWNIIQPLKRKEIMLYATWMDLEDTLLSEISHFSSVQSLSRVQLFVTPWTAACQASLSITNSQSPPKPMSIELVMPSNHLIFCRPLLLLPSIFPSIRVFSNESALGIRWPKYCSFSFNISPLSKLRLSLLCLKNKQTNKQKKLCGCCVCMCTQIDLTVASISSTTMSKNHK